MNELGTWLRLAWLFWVVDTWKSLPGPPWCRVALLIVCLAIPGPQDELLLIAVTAAMRARKARKDRALAEPYEYQTELAMLAAARTSR